MGRVQELEDLHRLLQTSDRVAIVAATGMGGIGKTQLAWHYLAQNCDSYPAGIWWLRAGQLVSQVFEFGRRMGWEPSPSPAVSEVDQVQGIWQYWLRLLPRGARLLVVDDVTNYRELKHFLYFSTSQPTRSTQPTKQKRTSKVLPDTSIFNSCRNL